MKYRIEKDTMGEVQVPADALWGAQTQRALENFKISGIMFAFPFGRSFIEALGIIKFSAASANQKLKLLEPKKANAIKLSLQRSNFRKVRFTISIRYLSNWFRNKH